MENAVCGTVITGTDKIRSGFGNGDCIYLDFENSVFAAADGSERYPWASRDLLERLKTSLSEKGAPDTVESWRDLTNDLYSEQKYHFKTTFSCISIVERDEGVTLFISHGGDSVVAIIDSVTGKIVYQTKPDMNFAGRSKYITDVTEHHIVGKECRVIVSTDGFNDFLKFCVENSMLKSIPGVFSNWPVHCICEQVHTVLDENGESFEYDDIGLIIIDPFQTRSFGKRKIIIGGTRPQEEKKFLMSNSSGKESAWLTDIEWEENNDILRTAGIDINLV